MFNFTKLFKKQYQNLNIIEISKDNVIHNYKYLLSLSSGMKVAPVVKSNGYEHGIINIAKILEKSNPPFFCVDSLYEAYQLQKLKIKTPVLITGYTNPQNLMIKKLSFSFAVFTTDLLEAISKYQPQSPIHIFIDTGMRREGVTLKELPEFLQEVKKYPNLKIEGVMSHLASTKGKSDPIFQNQIKNFKKALEILKKNKIKPRWIHIGASGGLINPETRKIISSISNLSRVGISLYGLGDDVNLKPTLKLVTHLIQIKTLNKGESVGYDGTFTAKKDMIIGTLPTGYHDGVDRRLSNIGVVTINGKACPIIGRVSMNLITVDLTKIDKPKMGQEVVVFSSNNQDPNSIINAAKICKTIPYILLNGLSSTTKRMVI